LTLKMPDKVWEEVQHIVQQEISKQPPPEFRQALTNASWMWDAGSELQAKETLRAVRSQITQAHDAALRMIDRLDKLGGTSRKILAEIPNGDISLMYKRARANERALAHGRTVASQYPTTRAGQRNLPALNMGAELARSIQHHLGLEATATPSGLFAQLHAVLAGIIRSSRRYQAARISSDTKALRAAIAFWKASPTITH